MLIVVTNTPSFSSDGSLHRFLITFEQAQQVTSIHLYVSSLGSFIYNKFLPFQASHDSQGLSSGISTHHHQPHIIFRIVIIYYLLI